MISHHAAWSDNHNSSKVEITLQTVSEFRTDTLAPLAYADQVRKKNAEGDVSVENWIVVGGCNGLTAIRQDEFAEYCEGYGWAAIAGTVGLLFYCVLTNLGLL